MTNRHALCAALVLAALVGGCSDDGGGGAGGGGSGQTLEPGREVTGCFDCADAEYCMIFSGGGAESYRCAEATCGLECPCLIEDGEKRHAECASYSCQDGSGILYCFD